MTELTKTLDFNLNIESGNTTVLEDATTESRTAYNKTLEYYFNTSKNFDTIREELPDEINLIKNTVQLIADKTYDSIQNYYENEDHNRPKQKDDDYYPLRSNHGEGYQLTVENDAVKFRISAIPYGQKVRGKLEGCDEHLILVKNALEGDNWRVGTSEVVEKNGNWQLHINITHETATVQSPTETQTLVGVDINESNVALSALTEKEGVTDSIVIKYDEVKRNRHEYFTAE
jgi:putative transposase